ncbi:hypothetical protein A2U01_0093608, partial [Trifolium medium]|nr:hypothetical protein [Trifolium medium]
DGVVELRACGLEHSIVQFKDPGYEHRSTKPRINTSPVNGPFFLGDDLLHTFPLGLFQFILQSANSAFQTLDSDK